MAAATIIEKSNGTDYVHSAIYCAWWFVALWALLVIGGLIYIFKRKVKHVPTLILHCSFVVILIGALLTHVSSKRGMVDLRMGEQPTDKYITSDLWIPAFWLLPTGEPHQSDGSCHWSGYAGT